jgi:hypothetical protein
MRGCSTGCVARQAMPPSPTASTSPIQAKSGTVLTILNDDDLTHRIVADDGSWDSGLMTSLD